MVRPTESEVRKLYEEDSAFFVFNGTTPNLQLMQEQHLNLARTYEKLGIKVHYSSWSEEIPRSAYGPMKRSISAAAGFVINGGAIIPREATPYWRGRSRYVSQFLIGLGCPILYTVHGSGVCEIGASTRMSDDFIVLMLSTDCNRDGAEQVTPVLQRAGYKEVHLAHSPGPLYAYRRGTGLDACRHVDPATRQIGDDLSAVVRLRDHRRLDAIGYELIECPRDEIELIDHHHLPPRSERHRREDPAASGKARRERRGYDGSINTVVAYAAIRNLSATRSDNLLRRYLKGSELEEAADDC
jgi:hypothetical protein